MLYLGRHPNHLGKEMAIHSIILAWRIPWTEETGRLQSTGSQRVKHDWATQHTHTHISYHNTCYVAAYVLDGVFPLAFLIKESCNQSSQGKETLFICVLEMNAQPWLRAQISLVKWSWSSSDHVTVLGLAIQRQNSNPGEIRGRRKKWTLLITQPHSHSLWERSFPRARRYPLHVGCSQHILRGVNILILGSRKDSNTLVKSMR